MATVLAVATDTADARRYRHYYRGGRHVSHHHFSRASSYSPPYSSIVVDANTGKTLHETSADGLRHPASLTKIMTLYLLFERLDSGKIKLTTEMPVSEHASEQSPTKLGLRPGQKIVVEDAIRGLVTRSANDAAVVIAEAVAGDEDEFAKLMTSKARALGMSRTTYRNASGLPDEEQVTTARDQAMLGRAIQERFPRYYRYFSTSSFTYRGEAIRNHNHLLGRVDGVDGIKTGYTRASGFNLVTSVNRNNRHIVAVVLGGSSAGARDARMRGLIEEHIAEASTRRSATMVAEATEPAETTEQPRPSIVHRSLAATPAAAPAAPPAAAAQVASAAPATPAGYALATVSSTAVPPPATNAPVQGPVMVAPKPRVPAGSSEPIKPIAVKTIKVKLATMHPASLAPAAVMIPVADETGSTPLKAAAPQPVQVAQAVAPQAKAAQLVPLPSMETIRAALPSMTAQPAPAAAPAPAQVQTPAPAPEPVAAPAPKAEPAATPARSAQVHSGWIIQIGAFETEDEAKQRLDAAQSKAKSALSRADAFTEPVTKGDKTLYRARFAGLERSQAEATCRQLKRNDIACMTVKN